MVSNASLDNADGGSRGGGGGGGGGSGGDDDDSDVRIIMTSLYNKKVICSSGTDFSPKMPVLNPLLPLNPEENFNTTTISVRERYFRKTVEFFQDENICKRVSELLKGRSSWVYDVIVYYITKTCQQTMVEVSHDEHPIIICPNDEYQKALRKYGKRYFDIQCETHSIVVPVHGFLTGFPLPRAMVLVWFLELGLDQPFLKKVDELYNEYHLFRKRKKEQYSETHKTKRRRMRQQAEQVVLAQRVDDGTAPLKRRNTHMTREERSRVFEVISELKTQQKENSRKKPRERKRFKNKSRSKDTPRIIQNDEDLVLKF